VVDPRAEGSTEPEHVSVLDSSVRWLLDTRSPRRPGRQATGLLGRLMPDPMTSFEQWQRFTGADIREMTSGERAFERRKLLVAIGLAVEPDDVPVWAWQRVRQLEGQGGRHG
jgi:hypothetical protein